MWIVPLIAMTAGLAVPEAFSDRDPAAWSGHLNGGRSLEIRNVTGNIHAEFTAGDRVEVWAIRHSAQGPVTARLEAVDHEDGILIRNNQTPDVRVDFVVRVPAGVPFIGRTVNGDVTAERLDSDVEAHTINGKVKISTEGHAQATTVNGSIAIAMGSINWRQPRMISTRNGRITVTLPADSDVNLVAECSGGDVVSDFPIAEAEIGGRTIKGRLGRGGAAMLLHTLNGDIEIRRSI